MVPLSHAYSTLLPTLASYNYLPTCTVLGNNAWPTHNFSSLLTSKFAWLFSGLTVIVDLNVWTEDTVSTSRIVFVRRIIQVRLLSQDNRVSSSQPKTPWVTKRSTDLVCPQTFIFLRVVFLRAREDNIYGIANRHVPSYSRNRPGNRSNSKPKMEIFTVGFYQRSCHLKLLKQELLQHYTDPLKMLLKLLLTCILTFYICTTRSSLRDHQRMQRTVRTWAV